ncbi:MAG TPA: class I SAM-dependent methyltransferase [Terriglobia bacterium]|nr:class I SAM-dependent methyltransferase [Terriglobia bacterium]
MTELPNPTPVLDLIQAFRRSKTMFTAVSFGIFDRLGDGAADAVLLAQELGANSDALQRLLDACVALGLLKKQGALYSNSPVAKTYLTRSSPNTLTGYILYSDRALYPLWGNLEPAIREGTNRWEQTFGGKASIFEHFFRTQEARRDFLSGMDGFGQLSSPAVVAAFDLSRFHRLVDLGGGTGHLALAACARYPQLQGAVFDLPAALLTAHEYLTLGKKEGQVGCIAGDFFTDPLPEADIFALGRILHDWSEEKVRFLLRKVWERLPSGGALLIAEKLLNDNKSGPLLALMQSLSMLVCTEGKERTLAEYTALLRQAGFARIEGKVTDAPLDAILAVKG